jgi:hypothetical protein
MRTYIYIASAAALSFSACRTAGPGSHTASKDGVPTVDEPAPNEAPVVHEGKASGDYPASDDPLGARVELEPASETNALGLINGWCVAALKSRPTARDRKCTFAELPRADDLAPEKNRYEVTCQVTATCGAAIDGKTVGTTRPPGSARPLIPIQFGEHATTLDLAATSRFLEGRATAWYAKKDWSFVQGGGCALSCHTTVPFLLSLSPKGKGLPSAAMEIRDLVVDRVERWDGTPPVYDFAKTESRAVEAMLNAAALLLIDLRAHRYAPGEATIKAVRAMWAAQGEDHVGWPWMAFELKPWETGGTETWGMLFASIVVSEAEARWPKMLPGHASRERLYDELRRRLQDVPGKLAAGELRRHDLAFALWAQATIPDLMTPDDRIAALDALDKARGDDGGWSGFNMGPWEELGDLPVFDASRPSSAYFTAIAVIAQMKAGRSEEDPNLLRALRWLTETQAPNGSWPTFSMNDPGNNWNSGLATDGATGYALYALRLMGLEAR